MEPANILTFVAVLSLVTLEYGRKRATDVAA